MSAPVRCAVIQKNNRQLVALSVPLPKDAADFEDLILFSTPKPASAAASEKLPWASKVDREWVLMEVNGHGDLYFSKEFHSHKFSSLQSVYRAIETFTSKAEYPAVFGCLLLDKLYLLVAAEVEKGASLPGNGIIWRVRKTVWVSLRLPGVAPLQLVDSDRSRLEEFREYSHSSGYYFSEDADLNMPFPFSRKDGATLPNLECDWTAFLANKLEGYGARSCCFPLIRGFVGEKEVVTKDGTLHLLLMGRQNKRNPGPRFIGRGLNEEGAAGNEHYYEYVMWRQSETFHMTVFTKHTFFRGTIPLCWETTDSFEAKMLFNGETVFSQTEAYFTKLFGLAKRNMQLESPETLSVSPRIRCVSLLKRNNHAEKALSDFFEEGVARVCRSASFQAFLEKGSLDLIHFDWLNFSECYGTEAAVQEFWRRSFPFLAQGSTNQDSMISIGRIDDSGTVERFLYQTRFLRINCADSLDRTNLGTFFTCMQVTLGMLRTLGMSTDMFRESVIITPLNNPEQNFPVVRSSSPAVEPPFLDSWEDVRAGQKLSSTVVRLLSELFTANGDCVSRLYTSSPAMHGGILRGISGARGGTHNAFIGIKRFYANTFEDGKKHRNLQLLLGTRRLFFFSPGCFAYFTLPVPYKQWPSAVVCTGIPMQTTIGDLRASVVDVLRSCCSNYGADDAPRIRIELQDESDTPGGREALFRRVAVLYFETQPTMVTFLLHQRYLRVLGMNCFISSYEYSIRPEESSRSFLDFMK